MKGDHGKHERVVADLVTRVKTWEPKSIVIPHFIYAGCEADLLQYWDEEVLELYGFEVKCNRNHWSESKAQEQLLRLENYLHRVLKGYRHEFTGFAVYGCDKKYQLVKLGDNDGPEFWIGDYS